MQYRILKQFGKYRAQKYEYIKREVRSLFKSGKCWADIENKDYNSQEEAEKAVQKDREKNLEVVKEYSEIKQEEEF